MESAEQWSNLAMVTSVVLYLLAMTAHAVEWASLRTVSRAQALVPAGGVADDGEPSPRPVAATRADLAGRIGIALTVVGVSSAALGVILRGVAGGRLPWGNMYEFVTTSLLFVALAYLYLVLRRGMRWLGLPVTLLLTVGQGLAVTVFYVAVAPLVPALHSVWFVIHIIAAAVSGAAFNLGAIASILYLVRTGKRARAHPDRFRMLPSAETLDAFSYRAHAFAFPLWTFTVAAGAIWADYAWGRFWGWDPKETWSLVTWVVYAAYLHARATAGWKGQRAAWLAVIGAATFWFNFVGINLLVTGLHSYAGI